MGGEGFVVRLFRLLVGADVERTALRIQFPHSVRVIMKTRGYYTTPSPQTGQQPTGSTILIYILLIVFVAGGISLTLLLMRSTTQPATLPAVSPFTLQDRAVWEAYRTGERNIQAPPVVRNEAAWELYRIGERNLIQK
jgi:hypothetical protein